MCEGLSPLTCINCSFFYINPIHNRNLVEIDFCLHSSSTLSTLVVSCRRCGIQIDIDVCTCGCLQRQRSWDRNHSWNPVDCNVSGGRQIVKVITVVDVDCSTTVRSDWRHWTTADHDTTVRTTLYCSRNFSLALYLLISSSSCSRWCFPWGPIKGKVQKSENLGVCRLDQISWCSV